MDSGQNQTDNHPLLLSQEKLVELLTRLSGSYNVYLPTRRQDQRCYARFPMPAEEMVIGEVRPFEPLKSFFSPARERVAQGFSAEPPGTREKPVAVVGVKACDLKGFRIQDFVFRNNNRPDPLYTALREKSLIVSADCTCAIETCFCLGMGIHPNPEGDFDLNLSELQGQFLVAVGSEKGQALTQTHADLFERADEELFQARDRQRAGVTESVQKNLDEFQVPSEGTLKGTIERQYDAPLWKDEAEACVECAACTAICPTCHCFLIYDQLSQSQMARMRAWDSCMLKDYARVAGGGNPRPELASRLRNRFEKKFNFFPKVSGVTACTGCGRCITACPAKIDIRKVLRRLIGKDELCQSV